MLIPPVTRRQEAEWRLQALGGLGQLYLRMGQVPSAEEQLRQATALGNKAACSPRQIVCTSFKNAVMTSM